MLITAVLTVTLTFGKGNTWKGKVSLGNWHRHMIADVIILLQMYIMLGLQCFKGLVDW